jgi:hypothetical protein
MTAGCYRTFAKQILGRDSRFTRSNPFSSIGSRRALIPFPPLAITRARHSIELRTHSNRMSSAKNPGGLRSATWTVRLNVQVKARGLRVRFAITVAGHRLPLPGDRHEWRAVAGVPFAPGSRRSARNRPSESCPAGLRHSGYMERPRSRGCSYHVAHPGGRSHDTFPVAATKPKAAVWRDFPFESYSGKNLRAAGRPNPVSPLPG